LLLKKNIFRFALLFLFILGVDCKKTEKEPSEKSALGGVVTLAVGRVSQDGRNLKRGDLLAPGGVLIVGPNSLCEILVRNKDAHFTVRLKHHTEFRLSSLKDATDATRTRYRASLKRGRALFHVSRLSKGQSLESSTPTAVASVRGTRFYMHVEESGHTRTVVHSGRVAHRPRVAALEDLPPETLKHSKALGKIIESLNRLEKVMEAGHEVHHEKKHVRHLIQAIPSLDAVIRHELVMSARNKKKVHPEEARKIAAHIDGAFASSAARKRLQAALKKISERHPSVKTPDHGKVSPESINRGLKEFEHDADGSSDPSDKASKSASGDSESGKKKNRRIVAKKKVPVAVSKKPGNIKTRMREYEKFITSLKKDKAKSAGMSQKQILGKISRIMGKKSDSLKLKNGTVLYGVIYQEGSNFIVLTSRGKRVVKPEDLAEIKF